VARRGSGTYLENLRAPDDVVGDTAERFDGEAI
jgi:hypothetical protein